MTINYLFRPHLSAFFVLTGVLFCLPLAGYLAFFPASLQEGDGFGYLFQRQYLQSLSNSLLLALCTACIAGIFGTLQALFLQRVRVPWRNFFLSSYFVPFLIPPYIHAITWSRGLGEKSLFMQFFSITESRQILYGLLYSKAGVVLILSIWLIPLVTTIVMAGLQSVDVRQEETALCSNSPFTVLRKISLPLITPHILGSCLLAFLFTLNSFDVPDILRVRVISGEIFIQLAAMYDEMGAFFMSIPPLLLALAVAMIIQRNMRERRYFGFPGIQKRILLTEKRYTVSACIFLAMIWLVSVALPVIVFIAAVPNVEIFWRSVSGAFDELFYSTMLSLLCALATVAAAMPYAYLLARRHPLRSVIDFFALIPLAVPTALFSIGLIKAGNFFDLPSLSSTSLFCLTGLVAHFLFVGIKIMQAGIEQIDFQAEEAAMLSGASKTKLMLHIILPQLKTSMITAFFLVFVCCFAELSATLLLVPPGRATIAVKIYNLMHYGADDMVASLCLFIIIMMLFSGLLFKLCYAWMVNDHRSKTVKL